MDVTEDGETTKVTHLEPSKLGTRAYWDNYYQNDIDNEEEDEDVIDPSELESWFDDVGAPAKTLQYLMSDGFPLSAARDSCSVLDLGTGNGSALFSLRMDGGYRGPLVGIDYSEQSIQLANRLKTRYAEQATETDDEPATSSDRNLTFDVFDLITGDPHSAAWWPQGKDGFDLVLDKGTFDAISLSSERITDPDGTECRLCELYPKKAAELVRRGGFFLITSCNWTEQEIIDWFTNTSSTRNVFEVFDKLRYKTFSFGGQQGSGVATVCFRRIP